LGEAMLWVAAFFTLVTGWDYLRAGLRHVSPEPVRRGDGATAGQGDAARGRAPGLP
jgi:hypothetical protein